MRAETLQDVLQWTAEFHQHLSNRLHNCADTNHEEQARNTLEYLADHEEKLSQAIHEFKENSDSDALNSWCYDHLEDHPIIHKPPQDVDLSELTVKNATAMVIEQHEQMTELFEYLDARLNTEKAGELLASLRQLEENEAKKMAEGANRMNEI